WLTCPLSTNLLMTKVCRARGPAVIFPLSLVTVTVTSSAALTVYFRGPLIVVLALALGTKPLAAKASQVVLTVVVVSRTVPAPLKLHPPSELLVCATELLGVFGCSALLKPPSA